MITDQKGKCGLCGKENIFVTSYLHIIGCNCNNEYADGSYQADPFIHKSELWICPDCRSNKVKEIKEKFLEMLKGD